METVNACMYLEAGVSWVLPCPTLDILNAKSKYKIQVM